MYFFIQYIHIPCLYLLEMSLERGFLFIASLEAQCTDFIHIERKLIKR